MSVTNWGLVYNRRMAKEFENVQLFVQKVVPAASSPDRFAVRAVAQALANGEPGDRPALFGKYT